LDKGHAICDEWKRSAGTDFVEALMIHWYDLGGLHTLPREAKMRRELKVRLDEFGFHDTIDRVIVQTAILTTDRMIVSDDSDFWDPTNKNEKNNPSAPVARLLREEEGITLATLGAILGEVHPRVHGKK
jgi:hypothetical protein